MKICRTSGVLLAALLPFGVWASGFSLYEPSAVGQALGGASLGKATDASANFVNPATLTDLTNITITAGFVTEHPRGRIKVDGNTSSTMDPGYFVLPHFQLAVPLPWDTAFGLGIMPEYGLGSQYDDNWELNWNSTETTVEGFVINPNLALRLFDRWSLGVGLRWLYFNFEQYSKPWATAGKMRLADLDNRLKGDNDFSDLGWQLGTSYRILDNLSVGAVYKSKIDVHVKGTSRTSVDSFLYGDQAIAAAVLAGTRAASGNAVCDLELPQSVAFGANWDITQTVHLGLAGSWTQWSAFDTLVFQLPNGDKDITMKWKDTWRFAVAPSWDVSEDWTVMGSYVYDMDCTGDQQSTMLPPADRHIVSAGVAWRCWAGMELALTYGIVIMDGGKCVYTDPFGREREQSVHCGLSHAVGFSVTYRF